jgi:hypothetical protein
VRNDTDLAKEIDKSEEEPVALLEELSPDEAVDAQYSKQPFRVIYQTNNFLLPQIRDLITDGDDVNLRPEYQRRLRWSNQQKSLLIESLMLNVPVPPVFFYENDLARYEVMDGQQRLNAIKEFLSNEFPLRGLQILSSLNGRTYLKLPPRMKRGLDRASISAIVLLQESQAKIKQEGSTRSYELRRFVFERLNTGGKRLSAQEIRNAIYGGEFNNEIVKLSRDEIFTKIWGIPPYKKADPSDYFEEEARQKNALYKTMGDCQLVLRFFALDTKSHIQGSMKSMLDRCMERNMECSKENAESLGARYLERQQLAYQLFDGRPFTQNLRERVYRPVAGIYDGVMIALDNLWGHRHELLEQKDAIQNAYTALIKEQGKVGALTGAANTAVDIRERIAKFITLFSQFTNHG